MEFKQSLGADARTGAKVQRHLTVLKTIAAFLNTDGGTLLIGVSDDGQIRGSGRTTRFLAKSRTMTASNLNSETLSVLI
ncbi:MAG: ATP-binding protein [Bryobacteraceae bacterium]